MRFKRRIGQCEKIPTGYGMAYYDFPWNGYVCYPIPLNWIVWIWRHMHYRLVVTPNGIDALIAQAHHDGMVKGKQEGRSDGYAQGFADACRIRNRIDGRRTPSDDTNHPLNKLARGERV